MKGVLVMVKKDEDHITAVLRGAEEYLEHTGKVATAFVVDSNVQGVAEVVDGLVLVGAWCQRQHVLVGESDV